MKPITPTLLCAALALAFSGPALAVEDAPSPGRLPPREPREAPLPESLAPRPTPRTTSGLSGQVVYQVLLAEVALQRGNKEFASQAYADLALAYARPGNHRARRRGGRSGAST
jgi:hypothetical protein